ncbi:hypothetical protein JDV02_000342 [Purpureocillium takamizusanense]|uniref:Uncharacterized protein n=1 Tax=Purpureocillium takamizusanense TaxID=2060973 RepID=A0A9Q8Q6J7_9HYPO|nr:uncharacterized protein JDV02_000342 [Purpureocillium takamizusanense]UNI13616.1 hypothetical protein JDV02_000342 [Purpureocillium takamizusanense]
MISVRRQDSWGVVGLDPRGQHSQHGYVGAARKTSGRAQTAMPSGQVPALRTMMAPKSEEECFELLAKELSSLPDREPPVAQNGETSPDGGQLTPVAMTTSVSNVPAVGTATNVMIAKTIRAAMSDIRPFS